MTLRQRGFTLLEMLVTATVLVILASAVVPMAKNGVRRQRELELRRTLREMRTAIDSYKDMADQKKIKAPPAENNGYPESLEILVEGAPVMGKDAKMRFLRRIPVDPMTGKSEWGLRSLSDDPGSSSWGGGNVFDVYSLSTGTGSNGKPYREW
ncbi:type II secretion system protein [Mesoterricola sediminis]|uniref:Type II secretion system pseudopilin PulG n=1 Tax=Mesoterricola sediminis TaxID=2927980 RepID=A0AA48KC10_9BACT|nr:prepilin-type N-terminal cleavage/methylation domain-containing protein [Mesoterricola sediminis]BDU76669.1 type II secretion system pseudopilin PulG [Mesoterricola sediminis]